MGGIGRFRRCHHATIEAAKSVVTLFLVLPFAQPCEKRQHFIR
jgi:hypothetical protein